MQFFWGRQFFFERSLFYLYLYSILDTRKYSISFSVCVCNVCTGEIKVQWRARVHTGLPGTRSTVSPNFEALINYTQFPLPWHFTSPSVLLTQKHTPTPPCTHTHAHTHKLRGLDAYLTATNSLLRLTGEETVRLLCLEGPLPSSWFM